MNSGYPLPVEEMFLDRGLSCVRRYSRKHLNNPKTVAEHTHEVERNTRWLCALLKSKGLDIDELEACWQAGVHDHEEAITGDFLHPLKYGDGLSQEEAEIIEKGLSIVASKAIALLYSKMPEPIRSRSVESWERYKARKTIESQVVKLADILSGLGECMEEKRLGNMTLVADDEPRYRQLLEDFRQSYSWVGELEVFLPKFNKE